MNRIKLKSLVINLTVYKLCISRYVSYGPCSLSSSAPSRHIPICQIRQSGFDSYSRLCFLRASGLLFWRDPTFQDDLGHHMTFRGQRDRRWSSAFGPDAMSVCLEFVIHRGRRTVSASSDGCSNLCRIRPLYRLDIIVMRVRVLVRLVE